MSCYAEHRVRLGRAFSMVRYYCEKCKKAFLAEKPNINQRHVCGEFAHMEWGFVIDPATVSEDEERA
jgi:hypothetical protein